MRLVMAFIELYSKLKPELADAYKRIYLGSTKVSRAETIHMPRQVRRNYDIDAGDELKWYAGSFDVDFPEEEISNLLIIVIKRCKRD